MSLLENHLEQIALSSNAISELPFPPLRMFTNALLGSHDITTLIRDTEAHERALFQLDSSAKQYKSSQRRATRRGTIYPGDAENDSMVNRLYSMRNGRTQSAVARVLGSDVMEEIKRSTSASVKGPRGDINVELLLRGAEMLCNIYPVAGAQEKIATLRYRYSQIIDSMSSLEDRVARNTSALEQMRRLYGEDPDMDDAGAPQPAPFNATDEDIERELEEIKELERRKQLLEERVSGMKRDAGGLLW